MIASSNTRTVFLLAGIFLSVYTRPALGQAPSNSAKPLTFEVATIKPNTANDRGWRLQPTPDGYTGTGISLRQLIKEAYGILDDMLVSGGPAWLDSAKFDMEAKFDPSQLADSNKLTYRERASMLQPLLADRFKLKIHREKKEFPLYALVVAKDGTKFHSSKTEDILHSDITGQPSCLHRRGRADYFQMEGCLVSDLASSLRYLVGRTVVDKTGLTGRYDFELSWTPESISATNVSASSGPSIYTALPEQLGLRLEPSKATWIRS